MIPQHYLHIYQRPKIGTSFIQKLPAYNYQHSITSIGWFDTASCDVTVKNDGEGWVFLNQYLGSFVQIYVDNPAQPIWEGLINRITFNSGGASYTISLDEMANRVSVVFTAAANVGTQGAVVDSPNSQAIYGIKQDQIEFGGDPSAPATPMRANLRDTILAQRAFPQTSISQPQGDTNLIHLELIGIYHTLEWEKVFTAAVATSTAYTAAITAIIAAIANGTTFFNNADATQITVNASAGQAPDQQRGVSVWERIQKISESGDGTNYWVSGILPTDFNTKTRRFYYRQFNSAIEYIARQDDGLKPRSIYGNIIRPWLVVPDRGIRVVDTLVGFGTSIQKDPRETYIKSVQYDANSQNVQWFGDDDTTARAAFSLKRAFKPLSKNMPNTAPTRVIVT